MQIPTLKPIAKKIILPAAIAGSSIAIAAPALTEKDKCDNTIEYMANSPATQSAALFGLFGLFGKKKEETVNEPEHDWRYFDRNYESIINNID